MLGLRKKAPDLENIIEIETTNNDDNSKVTSQLQSALTALQTGQQPDLTNLPDDIANPILQLATALRSKDEKDLARTVGFSVQASNSMAAVAKITGQVREIDSNSNEMAAAIEQLNASIGQISQTAQTASEEMQTAKGLMSQGLENVRDANQAAQTTSNAMSSMENQTRAVASAVEQITEFVGTVDAIAQQTNLLALNATIEAARAGDAGKGFAVVAAEVKSLSTDTQKATEDINTRIKTLQEDVQQLLQSFDAASTSVTNTQELTQTIETNTTEIDGIVSTTSERMSAIADVLSEQTKATKELAHGVDKIAKGSTQAAAHANDVIETVRSSEQMIDEQFASLDELDIKDYVLNRAKSDHFLWKKKLSEMLVGLNNLKEEELVDHHSCRLGKWSDSVSDETILNHPAYQSLETPHKQVHDFGIKAASHFALGDRHAAQEAIAEMEEASLKVVELLDQLLQR